MATLQNPNQQSGRAQAHMTALMDVPCGSLDSEICWFKSVGLGLTNGGQTPWDRSTPGFV
jgi:hypothetical protein